MKVLVLIPYKDKKEDVIMKEGDVLVSSKERFKEINSLVKLIIEIKG